jgi:signal transduction histidine kinase
MTRILIIDDEELLLQEIVEHLQLEGYDVIPASDGMAGVKLARLHLPDLILCDLMMPKLDGFGVLLELRSQPKTATIPFIFLTASADQTTVRRGMNLGADDYIVKPVDHRTLKEAIEVRIKKKKEMILQYEQEIAMLHEALLEKHEHLTFKSHFLSMASHDLRTPLSAILSSASLLRDYADKLNTQRRTAHLNQIEAMVRRMINMLDDILTIGRSEAGQLHLHPTQVDIVGLCRNVITELHLGELQPRIELKEQKDIKFDLVADTKLIRQMVTNLLTNALKYSEPDSPVHIELSKQDHNLVIKVTDRGIGIPEDEQEFLFELFHRATNAEGTPGTGLGLAIVRQAVDLHKGTIKVESKVNVGSTFTITLPLSDNGKQREELFER